MKLRARKIRFPTTAFRLGLRTMGRFVGPPSPGSIMVIYGSDEHGGPRVEYLARPLWRKRKRRRVVFRWKVKLIQRKVGPASRHAR